MGYNIYGGHLPPGHCEVHPDVPEPYPCSACQYEADQIDEYNKHMEQQEVYYRLRFEKDEQEQKRQKNK